MEGEEDVVGVVGDEARSGGHKLQAEQHGEHPADEEEQEGGEEVHDSDPLVVEGVGPGPEAFLGQVAAVGVIFRRCRVHGAPSAFASLV